MGRETESEMTIPEDLKIRYEHLLAVRINEPTFSYHPATYNFEINLIERIGTAEVRNRELDLALTNTRQMHADALRDNEALADQVKHLRAALVAMRETHEYRGQNAHCLCGVHQQADAALEAAPCTKQG